MDKIAIYTAQNINIDFKLANVGSRILAFCIDMFIVYIAIIFFWSWVSSTITEILPIGVSPLMYSILAFGFFLLIFAMAHICEAFNNGQSVGKMIARIRVVQKDGMPVTGIQCFIRFLVQIFLESLTLMISAFISALVTKNSQSISDLVAGTIVVVNRKNLKLDELVDDAIEYKRLNTVQQ